MTYPYAFHQGDLYLSWLRGGGGLGDPLERDPKWVKGDVNLGFLLPHSAPRIYGVQLKENPKGAYSLDQEGTEALRQELRKRRAERSIPARAYLKQERERVREGRFAEHVRAMYNSAMALGPTWAKYFREFWDLPPDFTFKPGDES